MRRWLASAEALILALLVVAPSWASGQEGKGRDASAATESSTQAEQRWWEEDIWKDPERGFHYYPPERERRRAATKRNESPPAAGPNARRSLKDITDHDELKAERERRLKIAIMSPTPENMAAYLEANTYMMQKSAMFADMWRRTLWANPDFDFNVQNPNANFAQLEVRQSRVNEKNKTMKDLAHEYGIVFFYRSDCPYCRIQAPVLRMLAETYGMEVLAVSLDGGPLEGWPDAKPDNGISMVVSEGRGVNVVPTLYLVSRDTRRSVMLGAGVLALDEIVERVHVLTRLGPGEDIAGGAR